MKKDHSSRIHPTLERKPGGPDNWVEKAGGLPDYIERIAKHIHYDSGLSISHAIAAAVERVKKLAAGGNPKAVAALAQWNAKRARSGGKKAVKLANETGPKKKIHGFRTVGGVRSVVAGEHTKQRNRGTSQVGSNRKPFDESKVVRSFGGKFGNKITSSQLNAARRIVESAILNLQIGRSVNLPNGIGWVQRTEGGYVVQGPAGTRMAVRNASEAVAAAAAILARKVQG